MRPKLETHQNLQSSPHAREPKTFAGLKLLSTLNFAENLNFMDFNPIFPTALKFKVAIGSLLGRLQRHLLFLSKETKIFEKVTLTVDDDGGNDYAMDLRGSKQVRFADKNQPCLQNLYKLFLLPKNISAFQKQRYEKMPEKVCYGSVFCSFSSPGKCFLAEAKNVFLGFF